MHSAQCSTVAFCGVVVDALGKLQSIRVYAVVVDVSRYCVYRTSRTTTALLRYCLYYRLTAGSKEARE